jgi:hypothetical protein
MKNIFIALALASMLCLSCSKENTDPTPVPTPEPEPVPVPVEYVMPFLSVDRVVVKNEMVKLTNNIVEVKEKGKHTITVSLEPKEGIMFSTLIYTFYYDGFDVKEMNFTYKLDASVKLTDADKTKLSDYLKSTSFAL